MAEQGWCRYVSHLYQATLLFSYLFQRACDLVSQHFAGSRMIQRMASLSRSDASHPEKPHFRCQGLSPGGRTLTPVCDVIICAGIFGFVTFISNIARLHMGLHMELHIELALQSRALFTATSP